LEKEMNVFNLLKIEEFTDPFFLTQSEESLKRFYKEILLKKVNKGNAFLHFENRLSVLKETSTFLYLCIRIIHILRRLLAILSATGRDYYLIKNHWLIQNINEYSEYIKKDKVYYCKKCGFPFPEFKFTCLNCGSIDDDAWNSFNSSILKNYLLEEEVLEGAKSTICSGCGSPIEGNKCKYCGMEN